MKNKKVRKSVAPVNQTYRAPVYLKATDPDAFKDMPVKLDPSKRAELFMKGDFVVCPCCSGHGGWHLRIDAYGPGKHFNCHCSQCNGYGWVASGSPNALCVHGMVELSQDVCRERGISHYGMCWHVTECKKCGHVSAYDSSD